MGKSEYQSQPTKRTYFDNAGYASDKLTGIDSIDPDGTVVISMGDTKAADWVKKLATLGGMPGVKTREVQPQKQGVAEVTGDQPFDSMMKKVAKAPTAKERNAERIRQKAERQADSRKRSADVFGTSPADKLSIRKAPGVEEGSKEDDPFDQGWRTFFRRGDETDNPYAKGTPEYAQWLNGFQEGRAQPRHYESVAVAEKAPPEEKAERMVKHIKKGYAKDGGLSDKERSIAYATAWKHHNK